MGWIDDLALSFALASTVAAAMLALACAPGCGSAKRRPTNAGAVSLILFNIGLADLLGALSWVVGSVRMGFTHTHIVPVNLTLHGTAAPPLEETTCTLTAVVGMWSFCAMSAWTCMLAAHLHAALVGLRPADSLPCGGARAARIALALWLIAAVPAGVAAPGHHLACVEGTHPAPPGGGGAWEEATRWVWRASFVALPLLTVAYCCAQYARVRLHFRRTSSLTLTSPVAPPAAGPPPTLRQRVLTLATKLDGRLLSYLIAYLLCQLPGLPAAIALDRYLSLNDSDAYIEYANDPMMIARMVANPLQGLVNALVFWHHARRRMEERRLLLLHPW